jgi:integrase
MEKKIFSDEEVFEQIKPKSRKAYVKCWKEFKELNPEINFEEGPPGEEAIVNFFKHLRTKKKVASSSIWTLYSYINSVFKRKYGFKLQELPRVTLFIKGLEVDTKKKAAIFDEVLLKKFMASEMVNPYWEVRQAIVILAFFGGLRLQECCDLKLEQIIRSSVGYTITHKRAKQRSDKKSTKFVVPQEGGYADRLGIYMKKLNEQLFKFQGQVWFTGTPHSLKSQNMGKNTVGKVPHEVAKFLNLPEWDKYTFHSFRRTSATSAADAGASTEQLVDFFGWKNGSMCQEYISSSKPAILGMASRLGGFEALSEDPVVEVDVEKENDTLDIKPMMQEIEEFIVLEEDPEMYAMAGIELLPVPAPVPAPVTEQARIESTIRQAMASVPTVNGTTVNFKIVVVNDLNNCGPITF